MIEEIAAHVRSKWESADRTRLLDQFSRMLENAPDPRSLSDSISASEMISFLFEIKRKSPSRGVMDPDLDPVERARLYEKYGAAGISVLTENRYFGGSLADLSLVSKAVEISVIRKDFVVDEIQLTEARAHGADAVLLIVSLLGTDVEKYLAKCGDLGLEAIVEVHTENELDTAIHAGAGIIGINNRNLDTLEVDLNTTRKLLPKVPTGCLVVAESGMTSRKDIDMMRLLGVDAVLIGTAMSTADSVETRLKEFTECLRK
jgi:indole-3-glycerol phosphate synthase